MIWSRRFLLQIFLFCLTIIWEKEGGMEKIPADTALMLVGVLPTQKDFEIARLLGWYRIPLRMAPKVVDVDYLAFYQTAAFGITARWQIRWFAQVRGYELTTRRDLIRDEPDHPHAGDEYYKLQLGPLQERPQTIKAETWKRITFLYTTGELFNRARIVNDLVVRSEERQILWQSLRDRVAKANPYLKPDESTAFLTDPSLLAFFGPLSLNSEDDGNELEGI
jgi:hypothetical protein